MQDGILLLTGEIEEDDGFFSAEYEIKNNYELDLNPST